MICKNCGQETSTVICENCGVNVVWFNKYGCKADKPNFESDSIYSDYIINVDDSWNCEELYEIENM